MSKMDTLEDRLVDRIIDIIVDFRVRYYDRKLDDPELHLQLVTILRQYGSQSPLLAEAYNKAMEFIKAMEQVKAAEARSMR
jgi:hypothetical protein